MVKVFGVHVILGEVNLQIFPQDAEVEFNHVYLDCNGVRNRYLTGTA